MVLSRFEKFLRSVAESITVKHVMTPRSMFSYCKPGERISAALGRMENKNIDVEPLIQDGRIDSFVLRTKLRQVESSLTCKEAAEKISINQVISEETRIETLLSLFMKQDFFFVIGQTEVTGIVTYADLNSKPVRVLLYILISELESLLLSKIKEEFEDGRYLDLLGEDPKRKVKAGYEKSRKGNAEISMEQYLTTSDIVNIVSKSRLRNKLGYLSRSQAEKHLGPLVKLRNEVMHPCRPLVGSRGDANRLREKYVRMIELIEKLE